MIGSPELFRRSASNEIRHGRLAARLLCHRGQRRRLLRRRRLSRGLRPPSARRARSWSRREAPWSLRPAASSTAGASAAEARAVIARSHSGVRKDAFLSTGFPRRGDPGPPGAGGRQTHAMLSGAARQVRGYAYIDRCRCGAMTASSDRRAPSRSKPISLTGSDVRLPSHLAFGNGASKRAGGRRPARPGGQRAALPLCRSPDSQTLRFRRADVADLPERPIGYK